MRPVGWYLPTCHLLSLLKIFLLSSFFVTPTQLLNKAPSISMNLCQTEGSSHVLSHEQMFNTRYDAPVYILCIFPFFTGICSHSCYRPNWRRDETFDEKAALWPAGYYLGFLPSKVNYKFWNKKKLLGWPLDGNRVSLLFEYCLIKTLFFFLSASASLLTNAQTVFTGFFFSNNNNSKRPSPSLGLETGATI